MDPQALRALIIPLPEHTERHRALEHALGVGAGFSGAWYRSQKEHWLGWLGEYHGPGAYYRSAKTPRDAAYIWNHIQCAPMLFWLAEALGLPDEQLDRAFSEVQASNRRGAAQCAALRRVIRWRDIDAALASLPLGPIAKARNALGRWFGS